MRHDRLDALRVISPCTVPWESMRGDDAVRFCGKCSKNVYDVRSLTRQEALELVEKAEGRVCMQLSWRRDGRLATGDCWARLRRARRRGLLALLAALPVILLTQLWSQAFGLRALYGVLHHREPEAIMTRGGVKLIQVRDRPMLGEVTIARP
jgi:hypothetical protein